MWLLIWSQIVNVLKSDIHHCAQTYLLYFSVRSCGPWKVVCLNAGQMCCLKVWNVKFLIPFSTTILQYSEWCYCSFVEWFLYLPGISIVLRNSGFLKHSMFWCCSVLYMCDRKCLKCEDEKSLHKIQMGDIMHLNNYISLPFFTLSSCKMIPKAIKNAVQWSIEWSLLLVPCIFTLPYFINCICDYVLVEANRHAEKEVSFRQTIDSCDKICLTRDIQCRWPSFRHKFSVTPCSCPTALPPLALFAALGITVHIAEGTYSVS